MSVFLSDLYNLDNTEYAEVFEGCQYPWEVLPRIADYVQQHLIGTRAGTILPGAFVADNVDVGEGTVIEPGAVIFGPTIIGKNCTIRSGAYIRNGGNVLIGNDVYIGHSTELKNSVMLDGSVAAHFNYVGDSILGYKAHLGAGAILSNTKLPMSEIIVRDGEQTYSTGLKKFSTALGDGAEVGCNAVLNPGSIIGKDSVIYPLVAWRGVLPEKSIAKAAQTVVSRI